MKLQISTEKTHAVTASHPAGGCSTACTAMSAPSPALHTIRSPSESKLSLKISFRPWPPCKELQRLIPRTSCSLHVLHILVLENRQRHELIACWNHTAGRQTAAGPGCSWWQGILQEKTQNAA